MDGLLSNNIPEDVAFAIYEGYVDLAWETFKMDYHTHGGIEINYIADGSCVYYVEEERYLLKKHNLIFFNSGRWHKVEFLPNTSCVVHGCSFTPVEVQKGMLPIKTVIESNSDLQQLVDAFSGVAIIPDAHCIASSIKAVLDENQHKRCPCYSNMLINKLLIDIARVYQSSNSYLIGHTNRIKDYIQTYYSSITCIDDISSYVGLNKTYMQRIFKQQMNCTIWQYLTHIRMQMAAMMLRSTDINIGDLDQQVGINSRQNFYLLFRKQYGMSPQEYRKNCRQRTTENPSPEASGYHIPSLENRTKKKEGIPDV